jgi:hypothetical protein
VDAMKALIKRGADVNLATKPIDLQRQSAADRTALDIAPADPDGNGRTRRTATPAQVEASVVAAREFYATGKMPTPAGRSCGAGGGGESRRWWRRVAAVRLRGRRSRSGGSASSPAGRAGGGAVDINAEGPAASGNAKGGMTPLHHAARDGYTRRSPHSSTRARTSTRNQPDGNTPILIAIINGQFDVACSSSKRAPRSIWPATPMASRRSGPP